MSEPETKMPFLEHLEELRFRILWCLSAIAVGFVVCWIFKEPIFRVFTFPLLDALPQGERIIFTGLATCVLLLAAGVRFAREDAPQNVREELGSAIERVIESAKEALSRAQRKVPLKAVIVGLRGEILADEWT